MPRLISWITWLGVETAKCSDATPAIGPSGLCGATAAIDVLAAVGGFELGVLAGIAIGAAGRHVPVLVDGYPASAAVLVAAALAPELPHSLIAAHRSSEPGHRIVLDAEAEAFELWRSVFALNGVNIAGA